MSSQYQEHKFAKLFEYFDTDQDGVINQSDLDALAQSWCVEFSVPPRTPEWQQITDRVNELWHKLVEYADGDDQVTRDEWVAAALNPQFVHDVAIPFGMAAFDVGDRDHDGKMSAEEAVAGQIAGGHSVEESQRSFAAIDTDGDGFITRDEYRRSLEEFYTSEDPEAAGNALVGRF
ncbi:EF-hand domain-containing protein [Saccharothrix sp. NRRL B-16314]|uniref:EF-hand domain-containing protein n=1 Tax=Saccharothrix sp. NRRL B-16314 TaxID=1463825 RepID=UPI000527A93A|nr:EF-hand domain-containing protein [Saccharothrix sp. NRRL B-16314]